MTAFSSGLGRLETKQILSKDGIRYERLDDSNLHGAVRCVSLVFTAEEPMSRHLGISPADFEIFALAYYRHLIEQNLSLVAIDERTDEVIGVRISEDYAKQNEDLFIEGLSPKFLPLFGLLDQLSNKFREIRNVVEGKYAHMFMVAVAEGYTRRGIAPTMYHLFLEIVRKRGFTHAVTEPTGVISQHILLRKFRFSELHRIDYRDFVFEDGYPFATMRGHECAMLLEKELSELSFIREL